MVDTHLLVIPPPGGSPGSSSAARNLITYKMSGSSSLDLIVWMISGKKKKKPQGWSEMLSVVWELGLLTVKIMIKVITFHLHVNSLLQRGLLLQCLLRQRGGAREADDNDADVVQTTLERKILWNQVEITLASSDVLLSVFEHKPDRLIYLCHPGVWRGTARPGTRRLFSGQEGFLAEVNSIPASSG